MFSVRFTRRRSLPAIAAVGGTVALVTLSAACGAAGSTSSVAVAGAAATGQAAPLAHAVNSASVPNAKPAGKSKSGAAGKSAGVSKQAGAGRPAGASEPAGTSKAVGAGKAAGSDKVTGATATALLAKAVANTQTASSVQVTGQEVPGANGQTESFDLTLVRNAGCEGAITMSATRSFKVVETQGFVWMLPSNAYYASMHMSKQNMAEVEGKYVKMKATDSRASDLATVCTFQGLLGQLAKPAGTAFVAAPTSSGYQVTEAGQHGTAFIEKGPTPLLLQIADLHPSDGSITFAGYDGTSTITVPPAAQTIDGTS
jgi:hypothetical protein